MPVLIVEENIFWAVVLVGYEQEEKGDVQREVRR